ncbi:MAG: metallophosphoesterase [Deltaproteobacteria bacterium]|nr:metallophosphoesterase [Deltaproteobacteria bacterium]
MTTLLAVLGVCFAGTLGGAAFVAWRTWPKAWVRWLRAAFFVVAVCSCAGVGLGLAQGGHAGVLLGIGFLFPLLASSGLLFGSSLFWAPAAKASEPTPNRSRRVFLGRAAVAVPFATASTGPVGATGAALGPVLRVHELEYEGLHPDLDGLSILQLSDVHLGPFVGVDQVTRALDLARPHRPELIVLTGDVADDYALLEPALLEVQRFGAALGAFGVFGNHENALGREAAAEIYRRTKVSLLVREGTLVQRGQANIWIAGSDDPAGKFMVDFHRKVVDLALEGRPADVDFDVLLSHRPGGFVAAKERGIKLTLAGHTHGLQVALFGRSVLEPLFPDAYLLGLYREGESVLYTSAGLGHWVPFRVNCPCEATILTLRIKGRGRRN